MGKAVKTMNCENKYEVVTSGKFFCEVKKSYERD